MIGLHYITKHVHYMLPLAVAPYNLPAHIYLNFWMVHYWNYRPNPAGLFANTHPCVSPEGVSEESLADRSVTQYGRHVPRTSRPRP